MKGPQVAVFVWLGNLLLFAGGGFLGYHIYTEIKSDREGVDAVTQGQPKPKLKRVDWLAAATAKEAAQQQDFMNDKLSMRVRPKPPVVKPIDKPPDVKPEPEPDDEALKAELKKWLESKFAVIRVLAGPRMASASVIAKDVRNTVFKVYPDTHFSDLFSKNADDELAKKLREMDVRSLYIKPEGVVFKAPSVNPKYKAKYFEVALDVLNDPNYKPAEPGGTLGKPGASTATAKPPDKMPMPAGTIADPAKPPPDSRPTESTYDEKTDTWTIGTNDFATINVDELAKYAKVVMDKEGKPLGIQITEEIPDNNVVIARGGKKGDIIKAINGKPVTSMSAVRGIVIKERDAGVETFVVDYERAGVPGQKTIRAPKKK